MDDLRANITLNTVFGGVSLLCILGFATYRSVRWCREKRQRNCARAEDVEGSPGEELIAMDDLPPSNRANRASQFVTDRLPRPRPRNEKNVALTSHPVTQHDLTTAANALGLHVAERTPATAVSPSAEQSPVAADRGQEQGPQPRITRRSTVSTDDPRRHGKVFDTDDRLSFTPSFQQEHHAAEQEVPEAHDQRGKGVARNAEFLSSGTAGEGSVLGATRGPGAGSRSESRLNTSPQTEDESSEQGFCREQALRQLSSQQDSHDSGGDGGTADTDETGDTKTQGDQCRVQFARPRAPDVVCEENDYDPRDPKYDVIAAVGVYGRGQPLPGDTDCGERSTTKASGGESSNSGGPRPVQKTAGTTTTPTPTPTATSSNENNTPYECLQRDYTNASLVPQPLAVRADGTGHGPSSPSANISSTRSPRDSTTTTTTTSQIPRARPVSAAVAQRDSNNSNNNDDELPPEPEMDPDRRLSFPVSGWPPEEPPDPRSAISRYHQWCTPAPDHVVRRSREIYEKQEWERAARQSVVAMAREKGQKLTEEDVADRVRRMTVRRSGIIAGNDSSNNGNAGTSTSTSTSTGVGTGISVSGGSGRGSGGGRGGGGDGGELLPATTYQPPPRPSGAATTRSRGQSHQRTHTVSHRTHTVGHRTSLTTPANTRARAPRPGERPLRAPPRPQRAPPRPERPDSMYESVAAITQEAAAVASNGAYNRQLEDAFEEEDEDEDKEKEKSPFAASLASSQALPNAALLLCVPERVQEEKEEDEEEGDKEGDGDGDDEDGEPNYTIAPPPRDARRPLPRSDADPDLSHWI